MQKQVPKLDRQALVAALRERYQVAGRKNKTQILQQFVAVSGYHRKSAIRLLNATGRIDSSVGKRRPRRERFTTKPYARPCKCCGKPPIGCAANA